MLRNVRKIILRIFFDIRLCGMYDIYIVTLLHHARSTQRIANIMRCLKQLCMLLISISTILLLVNASAAQLPSKTEEETLGSELEEESGEEEEESEPSSSTVLANLPLEGKVVFLDPGHGIGAVGGGYYEGYIEHVYDLVLAKALKENLQSLGATVVMTRTNAENVENLVRMSFINKYALGILKAARIAALEKTEGDARTKLIGEITEISYLEKTMQAVIDDPSLAEIYFNSPYDYTYSKEIHPSLKKIFEYEDDPLLYDNLLILSIHTNATPGPIDTSVNGTVTYYLTNDWADSQRYFTEYANVTKSKLIAKLLAEAVSSAGGFQNNGAYVNDFFMLRESNLPAVLVEVAYHTNEEDRRKITDSYYQELIAKGMAAAVLEYFKQISQDKAGNSIFSGDVLDGSRSA